MVYTLQLKNNKYNFNLREPWLQFYLNTAYSNIYFDLKSYQNNYQVNIREY